MDNFPVVIFPLIGMAHQLILSSHSGNPPPGEIKGGGKWSEEGEIEERVNNEL